MAERTRQRSKSLAKLLDGIEPIPGYDCLELKRLGQERIKEELTGLSPDEVRAYWRERHEELLALQAESPQKTGK